MEDNNNRLPEEEENGAQNTENTGPVEQGNTEERKPAAEQNNDYYARRDLSDREQRYGGNGYFSRQNFSYPVNNGQSAAVKKSNKLLIITLSVVAAILIAAIIGISVFYVKVLKPLIGDIDLDDDTPKIPADVEILDEDFDLTQQNTPGQAYGSLADAYDATHGIFVEINSSFENEGSIGAGSGFIVARMDGNVGYYIVTNNHVVGGATKVTVRLSNGKEYTAEKTILTDEMTDLAVIAIKETAELPVAKLGKSSNVRVGESVYVIGNPLGTFAGTLTNGIISSQAADIYIGNHYMSLLQTTAAINPGNSGGPIFNMAGEVIGVINAKYVATDVEGIGFAIPMDTAITVVEQMVKQGYVTGRHDLGITTTQNYYGTGGLWISSIAEDSSLLKAGVPYNLLYAYQINAINGIAFESGVQANMYIDELQAGDTITITLSIYELQFSRLVPVEQKTVTVTLGQKLATN